MTGACADGYAVQIASGRLLVQEHVPGLAVEHSADLAITLASLYTARSARDDLLRGLVFGLACAAEDTLPFSKWVRDPLEVIKIVGDFRKPGSPIDDDIARAVKSLESDSSLRHRKDVDRIAKALG